MSGDTPRLTATMAESYVTGERFGKGELFREAVKAIASGTHVVVPAADVRDAARYQWLRKSRSSEVTCPEANEDGPTDTFYTLHEAALDARIDEELDLNAALAAAEGERKP